MERYDSYKNSGVDWIGEIPVNWIRTKLHLLKSVGEIEYQDGNHGSVHPKSEDFTVKGIPFLRPTDVFQNYISKEKLKYIPEEYVKKLRIGFTKHGDIIFVNRGNIGTTSILTGFEGCNNVIINPQLTYIRSKEEKILVKYLFFQTQSQVFQTNRDLKLGNGSVLNFLGLSDLGDYELVIPPLSEQQQIVSFLDTKTSLIDSLIEKTQRKIELLKEKRTSLINEVVTKGLNPNVEMKDSGVEWIGEIPSHWEISKMKYGVSHLSEKGKPEKDDIKISPENVESETGVCFNLYSEHDSEGMKFQSGDILLNKLRLYLKKILFTEYDGYSLGEMIVLRTKNKLNNRYFYQLLFSQGLIDLLDSQSTGIKLPRVSPEVILNTEIVYPPLIEQQQIVEYLDEQTRLIDKTISNEEKRIELLKEYRQSLISEVVTGKRKVVE